MLRKVWYLSVCRSEALVSMEDPHLLHHCWLPTSSFEEIFMSRFWCVWCFKEGARLSEEGPRWSICVLLIKAHYQCQTNHLSHWKHYLRENLHRSMFREFCILSFSSKCSSWWPNKGQVFNETMQRNLTFFEGWPYMSTCKHFRLFHLSWGSLHQMGLVYLASQKGIECINMSMKMDRKTPQSMIFFI